MFKIIAKLCPIFSVCLLSFGCSGSNNSTTAPTPTVAVVPCTFTVAPLSFSLAAETTAAQRINVTTSPTCAWTATSNASFLAIATAANGAVIFTAQANTGGSSRVGTISVAGQLVDVTQAAAITDRLTLDSINPPSGATVAASGGAAGPIATLRYTLATRDSAYVCVFATFTADTNQPSAGCSPQQISKGTGTVMVQFAVPPTTANLPVTTRSLWLLMGSTPQFPNPFMVSSWQDATFNWTRP